MITIDQLNAIPGRPSFLIPWESKGNLLYCCHNNYSSFDNFGGTAIIVDSGKVICQPKKNCNCTEMLAFALYARRVEIEVGRMGHEEKFISQGRAVDRNDAIQDAFDAIEDFDDGCTHTIEIVPSERVYPENAIDLSDIGDLIAESCYISDSGEERNVYWKDGAKDAISVAVSTYATIDWYNGKAAIDVELKLIRNEAGEVVDWEEIE